MKVKGKMCGRGVVRRVAECVWQGGRVEEMRRVEREGKGVVGCVASCVIEKKIKKKLIGKVDAQVDLIH